jgi:5-methyltetrahydrofolate--homocysteine methyltransferase
MLLGTDLGAALATLIPLKPDLVGLNCATGPLEMKQHLQFLSRHCPFPLAVQPNAGFPDNIQGQPVYPLTPEEFVHWHQSFIEEEGVQIVGGCCGTTPQHLAALVRRVEHLKPATRHPSFEPSLASLYFAMPLKQEPRPFLVGERTNVTGSRQFRDFLLAERYDDLLDIARKQERGGAHALDVSTAHADRKEVRDMAEVVMRFNRQVRLPLFIDTTQPEVMREALKHYAGRCALNSINLEDGEHKARDVLELARDFGCAVVVLTIDEQGMAQSVEHKLAVAQRLYRLATETFALAPSDLFFDLLTFSVCSPDKEFKGAAARTLTALRVLKQQFPESFTILGISNVSYGLKPRARAVLNSIFLHLALEHGLDIAIVDAGKLLPLNQIDSALYRLGEDLLFNAPSRSAADPLLAFLDYFDRQEKTNKSGFAEAQLQRNLPEQIQQSIIEGSQGELELLLAAALTRFTPIYIIHEILIPAMKQVGDLFGAGKIQLPFVLQSAEVMKFAVNYLEPHLSKGDKQYRGTLVLATVKGDVHDIGKNLVDILLSNSGYRVINLGIKIPIEEIIRVYQAEHADAIGLSGLLVKSTQVMKENLEELRRRDLHPPVLLGGAALTRRYVEQDLRAIYGDQVYYAKDVFDALRLMDEITIGIPAKESKTGQSSPTSKAEPETLKTVDQLFGSTLAYAPAIEEPISYANAFYFVHAPEGIHPSPIPQAPFTGSRTIELSLVDIFNHLNETTLFHRQWQYRRSRLSPEAYLQLIEEEARPTLERLKKLVQAERLFTPQAVYGYFPGFSQDNELIILDETSSQERVRFRFPRQHKPPYHCLADYFRPAGSGANDVCGFFVVTLGDKISARIAELFASNQYKEYLLLHGLAVESTEAAAAWMQEHMIKELGLIQTKNTSDTPSSHLAEQTIAHKSERRGLRFSFGFPSCPNLEDQRLLFRLLNPARINVALTENAQMVPEHAVSALLVHHPAARYFSL